MGCGHVALAWGLNFEWFGPSTGSSRSCVVSVSILSENPVIMFNYFHFRLLLYHPPIRIISVTTVWQ